MTKSSEDEFVQKTSEAALAICSQSLSLSLLSARGFCKMAAGVDDHGDDGHEERYPLYLNSWAADGAVEHAHEEQHRNRHRGHHQSNNAL